MSITLFTPSRWRKPAGVFLLSLCLLMERSFGIDIPNVCLQGYAPLAKPLAEELPYQITTVNGYSNALVNPVLQNWIGDHHWRNAYANWQQSRTCKTTLISADACEFTGATPPIEQKCESPQDGYNFLVMHRYLLQTIKALRPEIEHQLSNWKKFPQLEDYPEEVQKNVQAWPDQVLQDAMVISSLSKKDADQILQRWPTEGHFGRWLQCGSENGLGVDALYGALVSNAIDSATDDVTANPHLLDLYLFWQAHAWIDSAWEKYRRAIGKMPDDPQLQAALIQQCSAFQQWIAQSSQHADRFTSSSASLYKGGDLNPDYRNKVVRIMGEVEEFITAENGRIFLRINPYLHGINHVWISSNTPFDKNAIKIGERFVFVGKVVSRELLIENGPPASVGNSALLLATAVQSVK